MIDVTLDAKGNGDLLKVDWRSPAAGVAAYQIDASRLIKRSAEVRDRLHNLITAAMKSRAANQSLTLGCELKELAKAGYNLRKAIFFAEAGDQEDEGLEADDWLQSLNEAVIHVTIDRQIYIPWGLVYDVDPESLLDDPQDISINKFSNFWCLKYRLSTLYNRIRDRVVRNPRTTEEARIVKLTNQVAWTKAFLQLSDSEQALAAILFKADDVSSSKDFESVWKTQKKCLETDLLYFFGHANGTALAFEKGDILTMDDFPEILRRKPPADRPACMVFLNGCHTAIGNDKDGGFLQATAYGGFCGFVGTEAAVPDVFALRFANAFLSQLLYTGLRAIDVMNNIRRDYWPLSLAYNLSCHPDFHFNPRGVKPPNMLPAPDFSREAIGSDRV
jgi:hypothetical protein